MRVVMDAHAETVGMLARRRMHCPHRAWSALAIGVEAAASDALDAAALVRDLGVAVAAEVAGGRVR